MIELPSKTMKEKVLNVSHSERKTFAESFLWQALTKTIPESQCRKVLVSIAAGPALMVK